MLKKPPRDKKQKTDTDARRLAATLVKLGVDETELKRAPQITNILKEAHGGLKSVIAAMRFSRNGHIQAFLEEFDSGTDMDRRIVPWEAWAIVAKADIPQLLGAIVLALRDQSVNLVKILAISHHPAMVKARIKNAMKPGGVRDRNAIDTALRFLPAAKGPTIIALPGGTVVTEIDDTGEVDADPDTLFPDLSETHKLIEAGR